MNLFLFCLRSNADEQRRVEIDEALAPPNIVDSTTGLPFGWDEDDELDGFEAMLAHGSR